MPAVGSTAPSPRRRRPRSALHYTAPAVAAVLVVPVLGDPPLTGAIAELDRRAGGELASLAEFGELRGKRFTSVLAGAGESRPTRLLAISGGEPAALDREAVV